MPLLFPPRKVGHYHLLSVAFLKYTSLCLNSSRGVASNWTDKRLALNQWQLFVCFPEKHIFWRYLLSLIIFPPREAGVPQPVLGQLFISFSKENKTSSLIQRRRFQDWFIHYDNYWCGYFIGQCKDRLEKCESSFEWAAYGSPLPRGGKQSWCSRSPHITLILRQHVSNSRSGGGDRMRPAALFYGAH